MQNRTHHIIYSFTLTILLLLISGLALAQDPPSVCVQTGALAWDNWTNLDAGGSGSLPDGETNGDYLRCKACHGWDVTGTEGGYVRRDRKETRPNAGDGDGDSTPRAIVRGSVTAAMIAHAGTGRAISDGTGSWVPLDEMHNSGNTAAHASGYTLGNQHPDFSGGDLAAVQIGCLAEFLNYMDADQSTIFANIDPSQDPVLYTIVPTANATAGEVYYNANCLGCHGDPATDHDGANDGHPDGGLLAYLAKDGKFSEFSHKARWGIPDSIMSYSGIGSPTSANVADMMLYLQVLGGTGFAINTGLSGDWFNQTTRDGEGFLIDVGTRLNGETVVIVAFYTYDSMGNQAWILGAATASGNTVVVDLFLGEDNFWGDDLVSGGTTNTPWGTIIFTFSSCTAGHVALVPNMAMVGRGFTALEYDVTRDLLLHKACPIAD